MVLFPVPESRQMKGVCQSWHIGSSNAIYMQHATVPTTSRMAACLTGVRNTYTSLEQGSITCSCIKRLKAEWFTTKPVSLSTSAFTVTHSS